MSFYSQTSLSEVFEGKALLCYNLNPNKSKKDINGFYFINKNHPTFDQYVVWSSLNSATSEDSFNVRKLKKDKLFQRRYLVNDNFFIFYKNNSDNKKIELYRINRFTTELSILNNLILYSQCDLYGNFKSFREELEKISQYYKTEYNKTLTKRKF